MSILVPPPSHSMDREAGKSTLIFQMHRREPEVGRGVGMEAPRGGRRTDQGPGVSRGLALTPREALWLRVPEAAAPALSFLPSRLSPCATPLFPVLPSLSSLRLFSLSLQPRPCRTLPRSSFFSPPLLSPFHSFLLMFLNSIDN